jgi:hypothetical protein
MADIKAVPKDGTNKQQGFKYRSIEATVEAAHRALTSNGVIVLPVILESSQSVVQVGKNNTSQQHCRVRVQYTYAAPDGSMVQTVCEGEGMDSGDKATSKALSMCFKYALFQTFCIPTGDPDPDGQVVEAARPVSNGPRDETKQQIRELAAAQGIQGAALAELLASILNRKVTGYHDLTEEDGQTVLDALNTANKEADK